MSDVTQILEAINRGDPQAARDLLPLVYDQLRALAAERLAHELPGQTLQATALVHEAYLRLTGQSVDDDSADRELSVPGRATPRFANRAHFFASAADSMRRILIEIARRKNRRRDLVGVEPPAIESVQPDGTPRQLDLIALDEALTELAKHDPRKAKLVELRFFAGLSKSETATCLGISTATVERDWVFAKAWLYQRLNHGDNNPRKSSPTADKNK